MAVTEPAPEDGSSPGPLLRVVADRRVAFLLVGIFNTVTAFVLFVVGLAVLGHDPAGYMASLVVSYSLAILCAFVLHRRFVFRVRGHLWLDLARFVLVNASALGANVVLLPLFVEVVGFHPIAAQAVSVGLTALGTYFAHRFFTFRRDIADGLSDTGPSSPLGG